MVTNPHDWSYLAQNKPVRRVGSWWHQIDKKVPFHPHHPDDSSQRKSEDVLALSPSTSLKVNVSFLVIGTLFQIFPKTATKLQIQRQQDKIDRLPSRSHQTAFQKPQSIPTSRPSPFHVPPFHHMSVTQPHPIPSHLLEQSHKCTVPTFSCRSMISSLPSPQAELLHPFHIHICALLSHANGKSREKKKRPSSTFPQDGPDDTTPTSTDYAFSLRIGTPRAGTR